MPSSQLPVDPKRGKYGAKYRSGPDIIALMKKSSLPLLDPARIVLALILCGWTQLALAEDIAIVVDLEGALDASLHRGFPMSILPDPTPSRNEVDRARGPRDSDSMLC